jgi:hypothetical protein
MVAEVAVAAVEVVPGGGPKTVAAAAQSHCERSLCQARVYALFDTPPVAVLRAACPQGPRKMSVPAVGALGRTRVGQTGGGRETQ